MEQKQGILLQTCLPHDKKKYVGSVLIIESETPEEVQKFIEADVYYKNEVVSVALPRMSY